MDEFQSNLIKRSIEWYELAYADIMAGSNLDSRLKEVEEFIVDVDEAKRSLGIEGKNAAFDSLKNEIYFLKYEILERLK